MVYLHLTRLFGCKGGAAAATAPLGLAVAFQRSPTDEANKSGTSCKLIECPFSLILMCCLLCLLRVRVVRSVTGAQLRVGGSREGAPLTQ